MSPLQASTFFRVQTTYLGGRCCQTLLALLVLTSSSAPLFADGLLSKLRQEVREPANNTVTDEIDEGHRARHDHWWDEEETEDDHSFQSFFGELVVMGFTSPFWGPPVYLQDDYGLDGYFFRHPYQSDQVGLMAIGTLPALNKNLHSWSIRMDAEYGDSFDTTARMGGHALLQSTSRWGLDGGFDYRTENLPSGNQDQLWTGDFNLVYRFAQSETVQYRTGLGFNWLADQVDSEFGFNFTYGADWLPRQPWIISAEIDLGTLGQASLVHGRVTAGIQFRGLEVYTGYDYYGVGGVDLSNLVSGIRIWY